MSTETYYKYSGNFNEWLKYKADEILRTLEVVSSSARSHPDTNYLVSKIKDAKHLVEEVKDSV